MPPKSAPASASAAVLAASVSLWMLPTAATAIDAAVAALGGNGCPGGRSADCIGSGPSTSVAGEMGPEPWGGVIGRTPEGATARPGSGTPPPIPEPPSSTSNLLSARLTRPCASERGSSKIAWLLGDCLFWFISICMAALLPSPFSSGTVRKREARPASKMRCSHSVSGASVEPRQTSLRAEMPHEWSEFVKRTSACNFPTKPRKTRTVGALNRSLTTSAGSPRKSFCPSMDTSLSPALTPVLAACPPSRTPATTM
mmetsp:Transcript_122744/g.319201  ORF Transcript_122744/g.319201 Transcript_122744/m.319201 type:complete len:256 (-) Transcript_122744:175-942(-)